MADSTPSSFSGVTLGCEKLERFLGEGENRIQILRQVNLELSRGCIYAVTGPSGCGKSTLLYTLGLLDREDAGEIWINGTKVSGATDAERTIIRNRNIGFVFQFHFLLPEFSALENVMLPMMKLDELSHEAMQIRANKLLNEVGLGRNRVVSPINFPVASNSVLLLRGHLPINLTFFWLMNLLVTSIRIILP